MLATADVDMSVPGYKYAVTFNATNVPFAPLWNTFNPTEKGKVGGALTAYVDIAGVGFSGESLQKSLKGTFNIGTTNLNLDVSKIKSPLLRNIVAVVAKLPEIASNPLQAGKDLVSGIASRKSLADLSDDMSKSPIEIITARGGWRKDGKVNVDRAVVLKFAILKRI